MSDASAVGVGGFGHAMLRYRSPQEYAATCAHYLRSAVSAGAAVLVAATSGHLEALAVSFGETSANVRLAELTTRGADPGRVLSMIRMFARDHSGQPLLFAQDVGWLGRPGEDLAEALRYEVLLCPGLAGSGAGMLCCYDAGLDLAILAEAERVHPVVIDAERQRASATYAGTGLPEADRGRALSQPPPDAKVLTFREDQGAVRRFTESAGHQAGLPRDRVIDLVIAVAEIAANTLRHTSAPGVLTIWATADEVVCQVADRGRIGDPLAGTIRPDPTATGSHRGLWLVHQVMDLVQIRTGPAGTAVRMHMRLVADGVPAG